MEKKTVEIRGFMQLREYFRRKNWPVPLILDLEEAISGYELAEKLEIPAEEVEVIFVNGFVQALDYRIQPGDRIAFLPPGCPGPYRIALGFYGKNQDNQANFLIHKKKENEQG
ncbi:MoaD/ThiS family protein [Alkaliphilus serpentinus]|uniref:MoaD/ThiS family protein n=1 Tax=Alkaliphilus serpentinus TaxID=1482731 RepID=A0A833HRW0_9FIRM|nr:MoaD/ThiS family protein [Alkaliphilus serpentinus]KAB3532515.1 MoaD/ThiS family protein [Alkaliphilus serpentinus]